MHMQQENVLAELEEYAQQTPEPHDSESVLQTVAFLKACNSLFERGILGKHAYIRTMESPVIKSMDEGYSFFEKWLDEHLAKGIIIYTHIIIWMYLLIVHFLHQVTQLLQLQDALFSPGRLGTYCA